MTIRNFRIAELVFNQPLMITESKLNAILHILGPRMNLNITNMPQQEAVMLSDDQRRRAGYSVQDGVATIGIYGPLMHRVLASEFPSGGPTTYNDIRTSFDTALADDGVVEIKLDIDSCGGMVAGVFDLAEHVYQSRGVKQITAVVNEQAYSAAYLLASAADKVIVPRTGGVGSIGVILTHVDLSRAEDTAGITVTHIMAGARKADGTPHQPLSTEALGVFQGNVNTTYKLFTETVARYRNMDVQAVCDTEAGFFIGKKAVDIGLADEVQAADTELNTNRTNQSATGGTARAELSNGGESMNRTELKEKHPALYTEVFAEGQTAAVDTAVTAERARITAILGIPGPAAVAHKALLLEGVKNGQSAGDVALAIQHAEATLLEKACENIKTGAVQPAPAAEAGDEAGSAAAVNAAVDSALVDGATSWAKRQ